MRYKLSDQLDSTINNLQIIPCTKIIISPNDNLENIFKAIISSAIKIIIEQKRTQTRSEALEVIATPNNWKEFAMQKMVVLRPLDKFLNFFGLYLPGRSAEGVFLEQIGLEIYFHRQLPQGSKEFFLNDKICKEIIGEPGILLEKTIEMLE